jgi:hypothetical protein
MNLTEIQNKLNSIKQNSMNLDEKINTINQNVKQINLNDKFNDSKKNFLQGTYLQDKQSIVELYKLFIFYGMLEYFFDHK